MTPCERGLHAPRTTRTIKTVPERRISFQWENAQLSYGLRARVALRSPKVEDRNILSDVLGKYEHSAVNSRNSRTSANTNIYNCLQIYPIVDCPLGKRRNHGVRTSRHIERCRSAQIHPRLEHPPTGKHSSAEPAPEWTSSSISPRTAACRSPPRLRLGPIPTDPPLTTMCAPNWRARLPD